MKSLFTLLFSISLFFNSFSQNGGNNEEWFELTCNGELLYFYMTEEGYYDYISNLDCEEFISDFGSVWSSVFISLSADSEEINEIGFEIYDCQGNLYLQAGAPYEGYTELPNDFTIVMVDYAGDGWNDDSSIYIDGYGEYTLEAGFFDTISNCANNGGDDNNNGGDDNNNGGDSIVLECGNEFYEVIISDYNNDGVENECDIYFAFSMYCPELFSPTDPSIIDCYTGDNNGNNDNNGDNNGNDWGDNMDCEEGTMVAVNGGAWMDEVYWTITTCDGQEIIAEGGAPYNNCISLPDNYVINMFDSFGDGWNGTVMTIGDAIFSFESCFENVFSVGDCNIDWWSGDDSDCENIDFWNDIIWGDSDWANNGDDIDNDFDWDNNGDGIDDFNWDDFDWSLVWDDYNLGDVDWENTPWDDIIDLFINPEDLINYLDEVIFRQLFNWNDFIEYFIENNSSLNLENNSSSRYIVKRVNIMGQNVNHNFDGVILYMYNDGSIERKYYIK